MLKEPGWFFEEPASKRTPKSSCVPTYFGMPVFLEEALGKLLETALYEQPQLLVYQMNVKSAVQV